MLTHWGLKTNKQWFSMGFKVFVMISIDLSNSCASNIRQATTWTNDNQAHWRTHASPRLDIWTQYDLTACATDVSYSNHLPGYAKIPLDISKCIIGSMVSAWLRIFSETIYPSNVLGAVSIRKTVLPGMAIPMLKIRRPVGRLIFNMGIAIPSKTVFLIETAPRSQ